MRIIVAPDSYKGSLSALETARAMAEGLSRVFPEAEIITLPLADGGEGTVEALVGATGGETCRTLVRGPLGDPVEAAWGLLGDGRTAVIEMAQASGLPLLEPERRDARRASSYGTGQLLKAALEAGLRRVILGLGGSATNDGGAGCAAALGVRFLDAAGRDLPPGGAALAGLETIDLSGLDPRLSGLELLAACDVDNPLCGPRGASAVFGPQKGAAPAQVEELDQALRHYGQVAARATGRRSVPETPGAGAAGGLGAGLLFFTPARLRPGIEIVLEALDFDRQVQSADLVFTGEGRTDFQTAYGKAPVGVARAAQKYQVPVVCLAGGLGRNYQALTAQGLDAVAACPPEPMTLADCLAAGPGLVADAPERAGRLLAVGRRLPRENGACFN